MPKPRRSRLPEFLGLLSFALALMLLVSLVTYDPADPVPFFKTGADGPARNFIGPIGAFLAELFAAQLLGMGALLLPVVLAAAGWRLFWCRPVEAPYTKAVGLVVLLLSFTAFLALAVGSFPFKGAPLRAGGAVGTLTAGTLVSSFNRPGAYIVVLTSLVISLVLATQFSFAAALSIAREAAGARLQATGAWLVRYREQRRKERMRQDVIRKHTQKEKAEAPPAAPEPPRLPRRRIAEDEDGAPGRAAAQQALPFAPEPAEDEAAEEEAPAKKGRKRTASPVVAGLPPTSLLDEIRSDGAMDKEQLFEKARALQAKSGEFGVLGNVTEIRPGPVVTTYEFKPDAGIKYSKIVGLADDLALALEAESIRIDRISGRGTVGIEIPNERRETISLREILESEAFRRPHSRLTLALGKTVSGEPYVTDLAHMPHLLIAGATGTGKSVGLNCMIASLLFKAKPEEVRVILIDPKRLELGVYEDIPHLLCPVVTDPKMAANVLKWAVGEMEKRIRKLASEGVRNIEQYNNVVRAEKGAAADEDSAPLHYIVIVIDELADLMMVSSNEVEESITRLAQMARAVGIHLILATQRPSVDVLTGLIKANFPSRISFRVAARVDSRTILDAIGAEHLLGKGDMLFLPPGSARLLRIHGALISEKEVARLTEWLRGSGQPAYDGSVGKPERSSAAEDVDDRDLLFDDAVRFVVQSGQASTSMLQRRFRIGFSRAGRLIDLMERDGIIGSADGSKPREILVPADYYETVDQWSK
jgi:S-DNA-T family DNA segregation ATPase FtsK/SpoIIIE